MTDSWWKQRAEVRAHEQAKAKSVASAIRWNLVVAAVLTVVLAGPALASKESTWVVVPMVFLAASPARFARSARGT